MAVCRQISIRQALLACMTAFLAGCTDGPGPPPTSTAMMIPGDSILPMATMIAAFQAEHPAVDGLDAAAPRSLDELIGRFLGALENGSGSELDALTLTAAEFAYLYFPTSVFARPPYAQPPAVNWLLHEQNSLKGRARSLRAFGGRSVNVEGYGCEDEPAVQGRNRIYERCTLRLRARDGQIADVRLFGAVMERDGRYRIMSLANRL